MLRSTAYTQLCDVAPNNIVRVDGVWHLADLDNVVHEGNCVTGMPRSERYRHPDFDVGHKAAREIDEYGLRAVLERITSAT